MARQAELLREGSVTSTALVEGYLRRIEEIEPRLNAFRAVYRERALAEAAQADARLRAGDDRPLLGVPLAVKDNVDVAGDVTAYGTRSPGPRAGADSEVVRRLRAAGAVLLGKTHLSELAIFPFGETAAWGTTLNPWRADRTTGGSSAGSAAAVAAGLAAGALGSDGGGSIRIPAACCHLFGIKPQRGRISLAPQPEHWCGLTTFGPLHPHRAGRRAVPRRGGGIGARRRRPAALARAPLCRGGPGRRSRRAADRCVPQAARAHAGQRGRAASGARARRAAALAGPRRERARAELRRVPPPVHPALAARHPRRRQRSCCRCRTARAPDEADGRGRRSGERRLS